MIKLTDKNISDKVRLYLSFICVFACGVLAHGYAYFNDNLTHDSLHVLAQYSSYEFLLGLGRYLTPLYHRLFLESAMGTLPWLSGALSLIFISFVVFFVAKILDIRRPYMIVLLSAMFATEYSITLLNATYIFVSDVYRLSALLAVLSVYFLGKYKYGFLLTGLFTFLSMGLYQAHVADAITLVALVAIKMLLSGTDSKKLFTYVGKGALGVLIGVGVYMVGLKTLLYVSEVALSGYKGLDGIGNFAGESIIMLIIKCYLRFFGFYVVKVGYMTPFVKTLHILMAFAAVFAVGKIISMKKLSKLHVLYIAGVLCLLPMFIETNTITSKGASHDLTRFSYAYVYAFVLFVFDFLFTLFEKNSENQKDDKKLANARVQKIASVLLIAACAFTLKNNIVFSNGLYMQKALICDVTQSTYNRILYSMENTEGFVPDQPTCFIGGDTEEEGLLSYVDISERFKNFTHMDDLTGVNNTLASTNALYIEDYFEKKLGVPLTLASDEVCAEYAARAEFQEMPAFPNAGYCKVIDGVMVVKITN